MQCLMIPERLEGLGSRVRGVRVTGYRRDRVNNNKRTRLPAADSKTVGWGSDTDSGKQP